MLLNQSSFWNAWAERKAFTPTLLMGAEIEFMMKEAKLQEKIISELFPDRNAYILDAGCGIGRVLLELKNDGYKNLFGVDISNIIIKKAKIYCPNVRYFVCDLSDMPFNDMEFDLTFEISVLLHQPHNKIREVIDEIKRVSKAVIIFVPKKKFSDSESDGIQAPCYYRSLDSYIKMFEPFSLEKRFEHTCSAGKSEVMFFVRDKV